MADLDYKVNVDTTAAQRNIDQLNKRVEKVTDTFAGMRSVIAGLAIGSLISRSISAAAAINDLSNATGIAIENIRGFGQAVTVSGGSAEKAEQGILKLVNTIGEAAEGSTKAQDSFSKVGVSLKDLRTLSEQEIFEKTVKGLSQISDTSKRAALTNQLLGKSFRGVDLVNVANGYSAATAKQREYAQSIKAAGEMQDKLNATFIRIQNSILKAIEPLTKFIANLDDDKIQSVIDSLIKMATALAAIGVAAKSLEWIGRFFAIVTSVTLAFGAGIAMLTKTFSVFGTQYRGLLKDLRAGVAIKDALGKTVETLATKRLPFLIRSVGLIAKGMLGWAGVIWLVSDAIKAMTGKGLIDWFKQLTGINSIVDTVIVSMEKLYRTLGEIASFAPNQLGKILGIESLENAGNIFTGIANKLKGIREGMIDEAADNAEIQRLKNKADGQKEINAALTKQAEKAKELREVQVQSARELAKFKLGELVRLSEDDKEILRAKNNLLTNQISLISNLEDQIDKLRLDQRLGLDDNAVAKIKVLNDTIRQIQGETAKTDENIEKYYRTAQTARILEEDRLRIIENITQAYDDQKTRVETLSDQLKNVNDLIKGARFEGATQGKMPFEIDRAKLIADIDKMALDAQQAFAATFGDVDALGPERMAQLVNGLEQIRAKFNELKGVQVENLDASRTWSAGWETAFAKFADDATNAAAKAQDSFRSVTSNMNSAIDNFVNNGKFKFKDLAENIIKDLIRIELKAAASKVLSPLLSGIGAGIGKILGFADGGNPPINKPSIVGERGPELFVPKTAGTVVPNHAMGGQQNVTNNYITNNISAVDAKSVAQLFAENRKTMLGTVRLAEKELSYR